MSQRFSFARLILYLFVISLPFITDVIKAQTCDQTTRTLGLPLRAQEFDVTVDGVNDPSSPVLHYTMGVTETFPLSSSFRNSDFTC